MTASEQVTALVVMANSALVGVSLVYAGHRLTRGGLSTLEPGRAQRVAEASIGFFYGKARDIVGGRNEIQRRVTITAFLFSLFAFILVSNSIGVIPVPVLNRPPTSHYSVTLALALVSVIGTLGISASTLGVRRALMHLVWPNPLQWVSEVTDVLSLSLRLFGNIAGEYMTFVLVTSVVPIGIPLILHVLGVIPIFVQAFVFTLLTASFLATATHSDKRETSDSATESIHGGDAGVVTANVNSHASVSDTAPPEEVAHP